MIIPRIFALAALASGLLPFSPVFADSDYPPRVKPIVEQRCMVCHGCYDAPCQLKLDAWAGLQRGASKEKVYDGTRLITANMTRLFEDAQTTQQWRDKGFYPVLGPQSPRQGVLYRMLELKQQHPLPEGDILPASFDFSLDRKQQCAKVDEMDKFERDYPLWGMPYGLPGLSSEEHQTLTEWLGDGAQGVMRKLPSAKVKATVANWESFFNGDSLKQQLMARYIYEHLFIGNLYFSDLGEDAGYYNLVRSRTPSGKSIDTIATRRPYDSPGAGKFYYRLQPLRTSVLDKRHMPYALNHKRMQRWRALFLDMEYEVTSLPSYQTSVASNPFITYRELPVQSRYEFMLDEAQFTIMGFIKGPVCRGQVALNVIDDHFWVAFIDPDSQSSNQSAGFLAEESKNLRLPSGKSGLLISLVDWRKYSANQLEFLQAKAKYINQGGAGSEGVTLDMVWDGDKHNDNAALTIFRHNDSASVVKGFVGYQPKTAWIIDYSLLERIHYLLVAGFDVFGNVGHQLETRLYMDFLRMEGEQNFLLFLPKDARIGLRDFWYRNASDHVKQFVLGDTVQFDRDSAIQYHTADPKQELLNMLQQRLPGAAAPRYGISDKHLSRLHTLSGQPFSYMPEVAFVEIMDAKNKEQIYTIVHNSGYLNNAQIFMESQRRIPQEDYLTVARGFIGSYPNVFFQLQEKDVEGFVNAIVSLRSEQDYARLVSRYGVRRNAPWFWRLSDTFHAQYKKHFPIEAGLFDLNRYENR